MKLKDLFRLCSVLWFTAPVLTSHFRGGYITWKPDPNAENQVIVTWRISWRLGSNNNRNHCDQNTIDSGGVIGREGIIKCDQCTPSSTSVQVICTDFNLQRDWSSGVDTANFQLNNLRSALSYTGGGWISVLNGRNPDYHWNLVAHVDLNRRPDNNKINSSPQTIELPIVYTQQGCQLIINVPVFDADGDVVRCRWADGEDGGLTRPSSDVVTNLDEANCRLTVVHNADAYIAIALAIEDFIPPHTTSSQPLSTVPLQFLVKVNSTDPPVSCNQKPVFVSPTPEDNAVIDVTVGTALKITIQARGSDSSLPVTAFTTISPQGLTRSEITDGGNNEKFIVVNWNPTINQINDTELFCFSADDGRQSIDQRHVILNVVKETEPPVIVNTPASQNVNTDNNSSIAAVWWTPPTASDNSGEPVTLTSNFSPGDSFIIGNTTVTYTALDIFENTAAYSFYVVVTDAEPPKIVNTPSAQHVNTDLNSATAAVWWTPPTASDNSGAQVTLASDYTPGKDFNIGNTTVTYTAVDVFGNTATYSFHVVVTDVEPPAMFNLPTSQNVNTDPNSATAAVWWTPPTASDNSGEPVTLISDYQPGDNFTIGDTTVTYTAADVFGIAATYSFHVVVAIDSVTTEQNTALWMIVGISAAGVILVIFIIVGVLFYRLGKARGAREESGREPTETTTTETATVSAGEPEYQPYRPVPPQVYQDLKTARAESSYYDDVSIEQSDYQDIAMSDHVKDQNEESYYELPKSEQGNSPSGKWRNTEEDAYEDVRL